MPLEVEWTPHLANQLIELARELIVAGLLLLQARSPKRLDARQHLENAVCKLSPLQIVESNHARDKRITL